MSVLAAERIFRMDDQRVFAALTGDYNPIHVDQCAARRTAAGAPVVHGVHMLLWALEVLTAGGGLPVPSRIDASFQRFQLVGEAAAVRVSRRTAERLEAEVVAGGVVRCAIRLTFGLAEISPSRLRSDGMEFAPAIPAELAVEAMASLQGRVPPASGAALAASFPAAARWLGAARIVALGACTRLVGMVCPGLHSLFSGLSAVLAPVEPGENGTIDFAVERLRHGLATIGFAGGGLAGQLTAAVRASPRRQSAAKELVGRVPPRAFAGARAIVAGGSRGLGEVTAKLLAAGGAQVIVTWHSGEADAAAVAEDIRSAGGCCDTSRWQVGDPLDIPGEAATHGYYFAAPTIARASSRFFDSERHAGLCRFFVDGFWHFALAMRARRADARLFYPSTVYVENWPRGLAEYAMAKAAGEMLCTEMNRRLAPLTVIAARLPRLPTDQTAGVVEAELDDPVEVLLPLVCEVQRG